MIIFKDLFLPSFSTEWTYHKEGIYPDRFGIFWGTLFVKDSNLKENNGVLYEISLFCGCIKYIRQYIQGDVVLSNPMAWEYGSGWRQVCYHEDRAEFSNIIKHIKERWLFDQKHGGQVRPITPSDMKHDDEFYDWRGEPRKNLETTLANYQLIQQCFNIIQTQDITVSGGNEILIVTNTRTKQTFKITSVKRPFGEDIDAYTCTSLKIGGTSIKFDYEYCANTLRRELQLRVNEQRKQYERRREEQRNARQVQQRAQFYSNLSANLQLFGNQQ